MGLIFWEDDPLRGEWNVVVVGPHDAAALLAREVQGPGDTHGDDSRREDDREFDTVLTHDRELVLAAARSMMQWVAPAASPGT